MLKLINTLTGEVLEEVAGEPVPDPVLQGVEEGRDVEHGVGLQGD